MRRFRSYEDATTRWSMADRRGRVKVEKGLKRVRAYLGGEVVADSTDVQMVWEKPFYPTYYFPSADVRTDLLTATGETKRSPSRGDAAIHDITVGTVTAPEAAFHFATSPIDSIVDHWSFDWGALDAWFEEDDEVFVHARDPYKRIDVLHSSRRIEVAVDGVKVADTTSARFLFETGLPVRYYVPKTDVRMDLLTPTDLHTECPYKGSASYYSVTTDEGTHENIVWWYPVPVAESAAIAGLVCFYNEKVDTFVDGEKEERPRTVFS
jgi:uncharacterized protein (DUF427 family)